MLMLLSLCFIIINGIIIIAAAIANDASTEIMMTTTFQQSTTIKYNNTSEFNIGQSVYNLTSHSWQTKMPIDRWAKTSFSNFSTDNGVLSFYENASESDIKNILLSFYDRTSRPVYSDNHTVNVTVGFSLYNILDTNEKFHTISTLLSIRIRWKDDYLRWKSSRVKSLYIPADRIWTPDIVFANSAEATNGYVLTNTIVQSNGDVLWMFPILLKSQCIFQVFFFPFDCQRCKIVLISWTYSGRQVDLKPDPKDNNSVYYNPQNQEWFVDRINVSRNVVSYECCPNDTFPDVTFTLYLRRRAQFYVLNLIYPCLLFYILSFLGFLLPLESGDKINMEVTVLLSLVVFMMFVNEMLPPTADMLPAIGMIVISTMIEVVVALMMAVAVTFLGHQNVRPSNMPYLLAWLLEHYGNEDVVSQYKHDLLDDRIVQGNGVQGHVKINVEKKMSPVYGGTKSLLPSDPSLQTIELRPLSTGSNGFEQEPSCYYHGQQSSPIISRDTTRTVLFVRNDSQVKVMPKTLPIQLQPLPLSTAVSCDNLDSNSSESDSSSQGSVDLLAIPNPNTNNNDDEKKIKKKKKKKNEDKQKQIRRRNKRYWMEIARILDRVFLIIFGILSGTVNLFLYMIMLADDTPFDFFTKRNK